MTSKYAQKPPMPKPTEAPRPTMPRPEAPVDYSARNNKVTPTPVVKSPSLTVPEQVDQQTANQPINQEELNNSPQTHNNEFYQHGNAPIVAMQQALVNLSKDMASHNIHDVADRTTDKGELVSGSNPFMTFLVTSYLNKAKTSGKQLVNTDLKQPVRMDTAKENDNLKGVLNTINRIGTPGTEQRPDGVWGPRTNNALKQIYALAYAMMELKKDMGLTVEGYSDSDLEELHSLVPDDINTVKNINEKVSKALGITKNLNKLRGLYDNFRETVLNDPNYRAHIAQEKPLVVEKAKAAQTQLSDYEAKVYEQNKSTQFNINIDGKPVAVMPYDLSNMQAFKKFCNRSGAFAPEEIAALNKDDKAALNKCLMQVIDGLKE